MPETYHLIVVGGGRASGLAFAAARAGWKSTLIEKGKLGDAPPNRGCIPSKPSAQHGRRFQMLRELIQIIVMERNAQNSDHQFSR